MSRAIFKQRERTYMYNTLNVTKKRGWFVYILDCPVLVNTYNEMLI